MHNTAIQQIGCMTIEMNEYQFLFQLSKFVFWPMFLNQFDALFVQ